MDAGRGDNRGCSHGNNKLLTFAGRGSHSEDYRRGSCWWVPAEKKKNLGLENCKLKLGGRVEANGGGGEIENCGVGYSIVFFC